MDRVSIGNNYLKQPVWKQLLAVPLIYLPLLTSVPFVMLGVFIVRIHLKMVGGMEMKTYWDFVPEWVSHRYTRKDQITFDQDSMRFNIVRTRLFWIFNCKLYCPLSVALFAYTLYMVKIVENWWCPFGHNLKQTYADAAIDKSFWHVHPEEVTKLHPDDRNNPIWNDGIEQSPEKPEND